jgi:hypothetical protein
VLPLGARALRLCLLSTCHQTCIAACLVGGLLAGAVVARAAAHQGSERVRFLGTASAVAALTGALGCMVAGAAGVVGMAAGVAALSTPVLLLPLRR